MSFEFYFAQIAPRQLNKMHDAVQKKNSLLTVQTLGTDSLGSTAFLDHSLSRWALLAALSIIGVLASVTGKQHRPLRL